MEIELPGEHLDDSGGSHSLVRIDSFLPEVKLTFINSAAFRRLRIRGRNGKVRYFVRDLLWMRFSW